ncbi:putative type II DNA modification enzyme (methyltransferase) [Helicobacter pylori ELS37]|uniref:DNA (cytosine-5-)-methyltransferase n=1 Tax=Helicobacter pylori ELS37 TaxID=1055527 RepID=A0ABC7ZDR6_HELPX|nr:putative type II DNA modification enzyme (methyltransferase) [Helicobacter pylori ELS37]
MLLVSRFLNAIDPFNLGVLLSRFQIKNGCIYGVCSYKASKFISGYEESKAQVLNALNTLSAYPIWQSNQESVTKIKGTFVFILENDLHLDENSFYKKLLNLLIDNDFFNRSHLIAPSNGTNSHPELHRSITPREAARIQSFSDDYIFYGNKTSVCKQIGNAVPPLLALALGKAILKNLRK